MFDNLLIYLYIYISIVVCTSLRVLFKSSVSYIKMKVLLFGHSYVKNLQQLGNWNTSIEINEGTSIDLEFAFRGYSGKDYNYFCRTLVNLKWSNN